MPDTRPASQLSKEEYAARAGVDVGRIQGNFGNFVVGAEAVPPAQVDTTQPSPKPEGLTKVPTKSVGPQGEQIFDVFAGQEHIADPNDPRLKGVDIAGLPSGESPVGFKSKFETGFDQANKALGDQAKDVSAEKGMALTSQYSPARTNDFSSMFVKQDPYIGELVKSFQDYLNPNVQRESLVSAYKSMSKELGLEPLNEKLINLEKIMRGTDESIREQITASGGWANENQIRALANARNKSFLEEYTTLQQTLASKEKYLDNLIGLEQADRQSASERFNQGLNLAFKLADYQQRGQQFAQSSYQWLVQNTGFDGLYNSTGGDPYAIDLIERTLGLPQGGLASSAQQALLAKTQAEEERQLVRDEKLRAQNAPIEVSPGATLFDPTTRKPIYTAPTTRVISAGTPSGTPGGGTGVVPKKLTTSQINEVGDIDTISSQIDQLLASPIKGAVGFFRGPVESFLFKTLGKGNAQDAQTRALIGNIKGTLAKLRGGTSFTVNEQKLLDSYVPSISESAEAVIAKATALKSYLAIKKSAVTGIQTETIRVRRKSDGQTGTVPSGEFDPELYEKI